jgi:hypothetical protein
MSIENSIDTDAVFMASAVQLQISQYLQYPPPLRVVVVGATRAVVRAGVTNITISAEAAGIIMVVGAAITVVRTAGHSWLPPLVDNSSSLLPQRIST